MSSGAQVPKSQAELLDTMDGRTPRLKGLAAKQVAVEQVAFDLTSQDFFVLI
jgi:hypothetical protein